MTTALMIDHSIMGGMSYITSMFRPITYTLPYLATGWSYIQIHVHTHQGIDVLEIHVCCVVPVVIIHCFLMSYQGIRIYCFPLFPKFVLLVILK